MKFLKINNADNVAVALEQLSFGEILQVDGDTITIISDIPAGHKFALCDLAVNEDIIKYGYPIGHAIKAIQKGEWVNEQSIKTNLEGLLDYSYEPKLENPVLNQKNITFKGYRRNNGEVGIRNEIWIIPTVGCVNGTIQELAQQLKEETKLEGIDAVIA